MADCYRLDGRTKRLHDWDVTFYGREFNAMCRLGGKPVIDYPHGIPPYLLTSTEG